MKQLPNSCYIVVNDDIRLIVAKSVQPDGVIKKGITHISMDEYDMSVFKYQLTDEDEQLLADKLICIHADQVLSFGMAVMFDSSSKKLFSDPTSTNLYDGTKTYFRDKEEFEKYVYMSIFLK